MKRGTDHTWQLVKYKEDAATFARCKCGFRYPCTRPLERVPSIFYRYCPYCGARKKYYSEDVISGGYLFGNPESEVNNE